RAEYARDLLAEQVEAAGEALEQATRKVGSVDRQLQQARSDRETTRHERDEAENRLRSSVGYGEQAGFEELSNRDREALNTIKRELMRPISDLQTRLKAVVALNLPTVNASQLRAAIAE